MSGYLPSHPKLYRAWNFSISLLLVLATLPLMCFIAMALALTQGPRHIFYFGPRIGKDRKTFSIIKFKTLRDEAASLTQDQTLPSGSNMETMLGMPLRETRLDELPQLFNVLRGDMNMFGPRPVRSSIAEVCGETIRDYFVRFEVKPGLVGYTQALTPHSTDKAIRARINARLCRRPVKLVQEVLFIVLTGLAVLRWTGFVAARSVRSLFKLSYKKIRKMLPRRGIARLHLACQTKVDVNLISIDHERFVIEGSELLQVDSDPLPVDLFLRASRSDLPSKRARCMATRLTTERLQGADDEMVYRHTLRYEPISRFHKYLIGRYFIRSVVVG